MAKAKFFAINVVFFLVLLGIFVSAIPQLPAQFYGSATINGAPAADGLVVNAFIGGVNYPQDGIVQGGEYGITVASDDLDTAQKEGGQEGDVIVFKIDGNAAAETGIWHSGVQTDLDLTIGTNCECTSWQDDGCGEGSCSDNQMRQTRVCPSDCGSESRCVSDPSCTAVCECTSGACCDGCDYRSTSYKCQEDVATDYECIDGTGCGNDVYVRHQDKYCSGSSSSCNGALQWDSTIVYDDCASTEKCANDDSSCNSDSSCTIACECDSGACCDGCDYRPSSYVCSSQYETDYGCPWGTNCGNDVGVRYNQRYCSGTSSSCSGTISDWTSWSTADYCASTEKCVDDELTCNYYSTCDQLGINITEVIDCNSDLDCGTDSYFGQEYCTDGNTYRYYRDYKCTNPGTAQSNCSNSDSSIKTRDGCDQSDSSKMRISDVEVEVDGKRQSVNDGDKIRREAKPGSKIKFNVEVENLFTKEEGIDLKDVSFTATIEGIDDGDDLDDNADMGDINPERKKSKPVEFKVPLEVEEDEFDVVINVEGKDKNGDKHENVWGLILEVKKEKHKIKITEAAIDPEEIECGSSSNLYLEILNLGSSDEENMICRIENKLINISLKDAFNLDADAKFTKSHILIAPKKIKPDIYPISIKVYNEDNLLMDNKELQLNIDCPEEVKKAAEVDNKTKKIKEIKATPAAASNPEEKGIIIFFRSILDLIRKF